MNDLIPYIPSSIRDSLASLSFFSAEISLILGFLLVILADLFFSKRYSQLSFILTLFTLLLAAYQSSAFLKIESTPLFGGMIVIDHLSILFKLLFCLASILFVLFVRFNRACSPSLGRLSRLLDQAITGAGLRLIYQTIRGQPLALGACPVGAGVRFNQIAG